MTENQIFDLFQKQKKRVCGSSTWNTIMIIILDIIIMIIFLLELLLNPQKVLLMKEKKTLWNLFNFFKYFYRKKNEWKWNFCNGKSFTHLDLILLFLFLIKEKVWRIKWNGILKTIIWNSRQKNGFNTVVSFFLLKKKVSKFSQTKSIEQHLSS